MTTKRQRQKRPAAFVWTTLDLERICASGSVHTWHTRSLAGELLRVRRHLVDATLHNTLQCDCEACVYVKRLSDRS